MKTSHIPEPRAKTGIILFSDPVRCQPGDLPGRPGRDHRYYCLAQDPTGTTQGFWSQQEERHLERSWLWLAYKNPAEDLEAKKEVLPL